MRFTLEKKTNFIVDTMTSLDQTLREIGKLIIDHIITQIAHNWEKGEWFGHVIARNSRNFGGETEP